MIVEDFVPNTSDDLAVGFQRFVPENPLQNENLSDRAVRLHNESKCSHCAVAVKQRPARRSIDQGTVQGNRAGVSGRPAQGTSIPKNMLFLLFPPSR